MNEREDVELIAARWVAREDAGGLSEHDRAERDEWLERDLSHRIHWLRQRRSWQEADAIAVVRRGAAPPRPWHAGLPRWWAAWPGVAAAPRKAWGVALASLLVAAGATWVAVARFEPRQPAGATSFVAGAKNLQLVALADGSRLTLEPESRVKVAVSPRARQVWLESGAAFFDVAKDPAHPFVVLARDKRITVLGTRFAVDVQQDKTRVVVLEGRVKVEDAGGDGGPAAVMTHGQVALADHSSMTIQQKPDQEVSNTLAWRSGSLVFDRERIDDIAAEFNKYNSRKIVVSGNIARQELSGGFDPYNSQGFINLIAAGFPVDIQAVGDTVYVRDR